MILTNTRFHMQTQEKQKMSLTALFIQDPEDKGFTGFFKEFPNAVAEGDTEEEVKTNLFKALSYMLKFNREDVESEALKRERLGINVIEKSYDFEEVE